MAPNKPMPKALVKIQARGGAAEMAPEDLEPMNPVHDQFNHEEIAQSAYTFRRESLDASSRPDLAQDSLN